jgi:hypothetical protein
MRLKLKLSNVEKNEIYEFAFFHPSPDFFFLAPFVLVCEFAPTIRLCYQCLLEYWKKKSSNRRRRVAVTFDSYILKSIPPSTAATSCNCFSFSLVRLLPLEPFEGSRQNNRLATSSFHLHISPLPPSLYSRHWKALSRYVVPST